MTVHKEILAGPSFDPWNERNIVDMLISGLTFEVAEGGFLDVDFSIVGPSGETIESGDRVTNGKYTFAAAVDGVYTYCFSNKMSTMTPKIVMFSMDVGDQPGATLDADQAGKSPAESLPPTTLEHLPFKVNLKIMSAETKRYIVEQAYCQS